MTRRPAPKPAPAQAGTGPTTTTFAAGPSPTTTTTMTQVPAPAAPAPTRAADPGAEVGSSTWIVEPGDSFWSIAAEIVSVPPHGAGGQPSDRQVAGYWRRLIEANRSRLLDPANPDLLVPGQELILPHPTR
jgi:nucleoid-associated protein YgaU